MSDNVSWSLNQNYLLAFGQVSEKKNKWMNETAITLKIMYQRKYGSLEDIL